MAIFKRNLLIGLGVSLLLLILTSVASYISITNLIRNSRMLRDSNNTISKINNLSNLVKDSETGQRGYLLTGDIRFLEPYNDSKEKIDEQLGELNLLIVETPSQLRNLENLRKHVYDRIRILDHNLSLRRANQTVTTEQLLSGKVYMDEIKRTITDMKAEEEAFLKERTEDMERFASFTPWLIIISALVAIAITLIFYRKVAVDYDEKSVLSDELEIKNAESQKRLLAIEEATARISNSEYEILSDPRARENLGNVAEALNRMAQNLKRSFGELENKQWLSSSAANLNSRMMGDKTIAELCKNILESLTTQTESEIGAIYLLGNDGLLHLAGGYALNDQAKKTLKIGEGISGQAFLSDRKILLHDIPEENAISFGMGNARPSSVIAHPIRHNNIAIGVLELAAMQPFTPLKLEFLDSAARNIGIAFYSTQNRIKLQELLEETQSQSEELHMQHAELENINAELEAQSQKLLASEEELRVQQEELMQSHQELEERTMLLEEKNALIEQHSNNLQKKSQELEQSTRYKSEFLANMSHELRTPLNSILLLSKLMTESEDLEKQYQEYAEVMNSSGQGLLMLIDEILDLSKIEAGKMTLQIDTVPVREITTDMELLFKPMAKQKKLDFIVEVEPGTVSTLKTDKLRLEQVLKNLLSNALKFTAEGSIKLHVANDADKKKLIFSVIDTGIGIAEDKLHMIFEAFQQADGSTQRKYGGTGLGLSISRELARLLGGNIKLKSTEGAGSEFSLIVPLDKTESPQEEDERIAQQEAPQMKPVSVSLQPEIPQRYVTGNIPQPVDDDRDNIQPGDKVILIIEDDTEFAKILLKYTREKDYKGIVAVRGDAGVELAQHYNPLAILLDIQLPVMDGWQVMEALKSNAVTRPIPVHMMSSLQMKQEGLLKGAVDFINKPVALEQLQVMFKKLEDAITKSPKKVLIVEENEYHANALSYFLRAHGINTDISTNVANSMATLQNREVDCVILDMGVPDKTAYETLETIKQVRGLEQLPIIVFTGKSLSKGEENRIRKYADSIVVKTAYSYQRILDEAGLFLHLVEETSRQNQEQKPGTENQVHLRNILKGKTVLIADDDVRNIFSLSKALETQGMKAIAAMDGKEALKALESNPDIDVVLMDMMMPEMDGFDTIREIRASGKFKNLPVLAVTAKAMMGDREKCIAVGASDFISKPVDLDQLVSLLRVWLYNKN